MCVSALSAPAERGGPTVLPSTHPSTTTVIGDTVVLFSLRDFLRNKKWSKDAVEQGLRRRRGRRGIGSRAVGGGAGGGGDKVGGLGGMDGCGVMLCVLGRDGSTAT